MTMSMNFIRRLNRENFYFSNKSFQIWWLTSGITEKIQNIIPIKFIPASPKKQANVRPNFIKFVNVFGFCHLTEVHLIIFIF